MNFEEHVIASLARLEAQMETLVGNGQPGRIAVLEGRVFKLIVWVVAITVLLVGPTALVAFLK